MAKNPMYSPYLQYAPTFKWGGKTWSAADAGAFQALLRKKGVSPRKWLANHPTAAKVFDPVQGQIYSAVQPQLTAIDYAKKQDQASWERRMKNLQGFALALMPYLRGVGNAVREPYRQGAATMGAAGTGYGGVLNADSAAEAAGANQVLNSIGAPAGQQIQGGDPGSVLAGVAGWIPQTMMQTQGGAYGAAADQLPATASLEAQIKMNDLLRQSAESGAGFNDQILQVLQKIPGFQQQIQTQLQSQQLAQDKFAADQHYKNYLILKGQQQTAISQGHLKLAAAAGARADAELRLAQGTQNRLNMGSMGRDAAGNPKPNMVSAPNGQVYDPSKFRWNPKTQTIVAKPKGGKSGSVTDQPKRIRAKMAGDLKGYWLGKGATKRRPTYSEAFTYLYQKYLGYVASFGGEAAYDRVLSEILRSQGIVAGAGSATPAAPGGTGNPPGYAP